MEETLSLDELADAQMQRDRDRILIYLCDKEVRLQSHWLVSSKEFKLSWQKILLNEIIFKHWDESPLLEDLQMELNQLPQKYLSEGDKLQIVEFLEANWSKQQEHPGRAVEGIRSYALHCQYERLRKAAIAGDMDAAEEIIRKYRSLESQEEYTKIIKFSDLDAIIKRYKEDYPDDLVAVPVDYRIINEGTAAGGLLPGDLMMIAGSTGSGKTHAVWGILYSFARRKHNAFYVNLGEDNLNDGVERVMSNANLEELDKMQTHFIEAITKYHSEDYMDRISSLTLDADSTSIEQLIQRIKDYHAKSPFSVLGIDYDLNIKPSGSQDDRTSSYWHGTRVYTALRDLARKLKIAIVIGCQTNREAKDMWVTKHDIADSFGKTYPCTIIVGIGRHLGFKKDPNDYSLIGVMRLIKVRRGSGRSKRTGRNFAYVHFNTIYSRLVEIEETMYNDFEERIGKGEEINPLESVMALENALTAEQQEALDSIEDVPDAS